MNGWKSPVQVLDPATLSCPRPALGESLMFDLEGTVSKGFRGHHKQGDFVFSAKCRGTVRHIQARK